MSRGSLEEAWGVIDEIRRELGKVSQEVYGLGIESAHCKKNQESTDKEIKDMCTQLRTTDAAIQLKMSALNNELKTAIEQQGQLISAQIDILMKAHLMRKGAESAAIGFAKYLPKIIVAVVSGTFAATVVWMTKT